MEFGFLFIYLFCILKISAERVENWCLEAKLEKIQSTNIEILLAYSCRINIPHFIALFRSDSVPKFTDSLWVSFRKDSGSPVTLFK